MYVLVRGHSRCNALQFSRSSRPCGAPGPRTGADLSSYHDISPMGDAFDLLAFEREGFSIFRVLPAAEVAR